MRRLNSWQWFLFYQQLQYLLVAGISLVAALELLASQGFVLRLRELCGFLAAGVLRGLSLTEAARLSHYFATLDLHLLAVGEVSGHLTAIVGMLTLHHERHYQFRLHLKKSLAYPLFIVLLSVMVLMVMVVFLVPQFGRLFANVGMALPLLTRIVMHLADFMMVGLMVSVVVLLIIIGALKLLRSRRPDWLELAIQRVPLLGKLWQLTVWQRFCKTLGVMLQAGLPLLQALPIVAEASGSALCAAALFMVGKELQQGVGLQQAFERQLFFPKILLLLIAIGENTGRLDEVLLQQARSFEQQLIQGLTLFNQWLEPMLLISVGIIVGVIVIALYLPIFEMGKVF